MHYILHLLHISLSNGTLSYPCFLVIAFVGKERARWYHKDALLLIPTPPMPPLEAAAPHGPRRAATRHFIQGGWGRGGGGGVFVYCLTSGCHRKFSLPVPATLLLRGDIKKSGGFGWYVPQSRNPPSHPHWQLYNYHFLLWKKTFFFRKITDQFQN